MTIRERVCCPPGLVLIPLVVHAGSDRVVRLVQQSSVGLGVVLGLVEQSSVELQRGNPAWDSSVGMDLVLGLQSGSGTVDPGLSLGE